MAQTANNSPPLPVWGAALLGILMAMAAFVALTRYAKRSDPSPGQRNRVLIVAAAIGIGLAGVGVSTHLFAIAIVGGVAFLVLSGILLFRLRAS